MDTTSSSLTNSGTRLNDPLKGLQEEFELLSNAAQTNSSRPSRVNVYLQRLKGGFDAMAVAIDSFQKEREEYETIIEAQAKELADVRCKAVCEKCGEGTASARATLDRPTTSGGVNMTRRSSTSPSRPSLMRKLLQPLAVTAQPFPPKPHFNTSQPVVQSHTTNLTSPLPGGSTSIFDTIIFNDEVKQEIDVEIVHRLPHPGTVRCVKFSRDGKYVAAGCENGNSYVYEVQSGELLCNFRNPSPANFWNSSTCLCFGHDGRYLATASAYDFCIYIWKITSGKLHKTFKGHTGVINSLNFSPNGRLFVSASDDNTVRLWNNRLERALTADPLKMSHRCTSAVFSPDGTYVAASNNKGMVRIWEVHSGKLVRSVNAHVGWANSVWFMPDGESLISGGELTLKFWDVGSLSRTDCWGGPVAEHKLEFSGHEGDIWSLAISPDGRWVASGSNDKRVRIWDTRDASKHCVLAHESYVFTVDFSPAGGYLASAGSDGTVVIWRYSYITPGASGLDGSDLLPSTLP